MNKENSNNQIIMGGAVLIVILLVLFGFNILSTKNKLPENALTLTIDFGNGEKKSFYNYSNEMKNAWGLLQQTAALSRMDLEVGAGFMPVRIDGKKNGDDNKKWQLYVNDEKRDISPIDVKVKIPDEVLYKFE